MSLDAGRLRHKIEIQYKVDAQDSTTGEMVTVWTKFVGPIWAAVDFMSAREFMAANAVQSEIVGRVTIRYREGVTAAMRVVYNNVAYNIVGVLPDNETGREYITMPVTAGVNLG